MAASTLLSRLVALDPRRARTYDDADGCVTVMRKQYARRANGQIIGANSGPGSHSWTPTRVPLADAVAYAEKSAADKAALKAEMANDNREIAACYQLEIDALMGNIALKNEMLSHAAIPASLHPMFRKDIAGFEAQIADLKIKISERVS